MHHALRLLCAVALAGATSTVAAATTGGAAPACVDFDAAFCARHAEFVCGRPPTAVECAETCGRCAERFALNGTDGGCSLCASDGGASYADCSQCDFGSGDRPCEETTALLVNKDAPLAAIFSWSPTTGPVALQKLAAGGPVPHAPGLAYFGDGYLYMAGGDYQPQSAEVHRVDLRDGAWEQLPSLPEGRDFPGNGALGSVGAQLVACGGWSDNRRDCLQLDTGNRSATGWQSVPVPETMCGKRATVATHKCRVYVTGGTCHGQRHAVHSYDPYTRTFRQEPPMLYTRNEHGLASSGDTLIACGGYGAKVGSVDEPSELNSCEALKEGADEWVEIAAMSTGRTQFSLVSLNKALAAVGGAGRASVELLKGAQWEVSPLALGEPTKWCGAVAVPQRYVAALWGDGAEDVRED